MQTTDTLIVGGGLSGLRLADIMHRSGKAFHLVEARARLGGRIWSPSDGAARFDMGPAWFWPDQPRMFELTQQLGLTVFEQFSNGAVSFEDQRGVVHRDMGTSSMQGSLRIDGGMGALVDALSARLPASAIETSAPVTTLRFADGLVRAKVDTKAGKRVITANRVVLALPPRVAAQMIAYDPPLSPRVLQDMAEIPTWMAGHAKIVATYDTAFWRDAGLSGDASSQRGPLVEIHDASPKNGGPFALFGFVGIPADIRKGQSDALKSAAIAQLSRIFGPDAEHPRKVFLTDWACEPTTATDADLAPVYAHPAYGLPASLQDLFGGALHLGSTETAPQFGGYLEGALEAAEIVASRV